MLVSKHQNKSLKLLFLSDIFLDGNVTSDHLSTLMGIIVFLFPLIGMIYALYVKKDKPAVFPTAMIVAVCGFLLGMVFMLIAGGFPFYMTFFGSLG